MVKLTDYEQRMLDGEMGRFKQAAMENIVKYANALGAEELCEVTKAHLNMGCPPLSYGISDNYDEHFRRVYLCSEDLIKFDKFSEKCFTQTDIGAVDLYDYKPMRHSKELFDLNKQRQELAVEAGVSIVGSCTPYLAGWLPTRGEHFVTTESSNVLMSNSVFGACGNADGTSAVAWSAITGRTPKWGYHLPENRYGTVGFEIKCKDETPQDWDIIGYTVGRTLKLNAVPVIIGTYKNVNIIKLKRFFSSLATTSGAEMCHITGVTPEAMTKEQAFGGKEPENIIVITQEDYDESFRKLCDTGSADVQFVSLGCPHYTLEEIRDVARYIKGKKIHKNVNFIVWTSCPMREAANQSGYLKIIEDAGGHIGTNGCPVTQGPNCFEGVTGMAVDAAKQAHYGRSYTPAKMFYGTMEQCVDAAVKGRWEGK